MQISTSQQQKIILIGLMVVGGISGSIGLLIGLYPFATTIKQVRFQAAVAGGLMAAGLVFSGAAVLLAKHYKAQNQAAGDAAATPLIPQNPIISQNP